MTSVTHPAPSRFYLLDGMRGLAAVAVILFHISGFLQAHFAGGGYLAVDLFFLLSGFVIAKAYDRRMDDGLSLAGFVRIRLIRLYPLFALGLLFGIVRSIGRIAYGSRDPLSIHHFLESTVLNALMIPVPFASRDLFPHNGPLWSLFFEMVINIAYAAGLWRFERKGLLCIVLIGAAGMIFGAWLDPATGLDIGWNRETIGFGLARVTYGFVFGLVLARLPAARTLRGKTGMAWAFLLIAMLLGFLLVPVPATATTMRDLAFAFGVAPFVVWLGSRIVIDSRAVRPLFLLGLISYPLYALHLPVMDAVGIVAIWLHVGVAVSTVVILLACLVAAWLAGRYFDEPVRTWLGKTLAPRRPAVPPAVERPASSCRPTEANVPLPVPCPRPAP